MILIGQYDSPFVRRVGIALHLYGLPFTQEPWSVFGDAERIAPVNPLIRVPTLLLDDGEVLVESAAILDALDGMVQPGLQLVPPATFETAVARRKVMRICALATGMADKAVSLIYERVLHTERSAAWETRCQSQIRSVLAVLETDRAAGDTEWWFGPMLTHADIAVGCALRFLRDAHPALFDAARWPALAAHSERAEALPPFIAIRQAFRPPD